MTEKREWRDLACEAMEGLPFGLEREEYAHCTLTRARVDRDGAKLISKPEGNYVSLMFGEPSALDVEAVKEIETLLFGELVRMSVGSGAEGNAAVLVAGLGNADVTFDRLGAVVCRKIVPDGQRSFVFQSEVESMSGIKSVEAIRSIAELVGAGLVIAVDSLVARDCGRVQRVIQLSDSGISPGSGVGKHQKNLDRESLGVPVIAVGAPLASAFDDRFAVCGDVLLVSEIIGGIIGTAISGFLHRNEPKVEQKRREN